MMFLGSDSKKNPDRNPQNDEMANQLGIMAGVLFVGGIAVLFTVKYILVVLLGSLIGFLTYLSRFHVGWAAKLKSAFFTLAFFALFYFVGLGAPWNLPYRWYGALFHVPGFMKFCVSIAVWWNEFIGELAFQFFKSWQIRQVTALGVSQYVWLSYGAGVLFSLLFFVLGYFGKFKTSISPVGLKIGSFPAKGFQGISYCLFSGWVRFGRSNSLEKGGFIAQVLLGGLLLWSASLITGYERRVPFTEFKWAMHFLSWLPGVGIWIGFLLGFVPGGGKLVEFFFGKEVPKKESDYPGFYLGKTFSGHSFRLTEKNLGHHVEIVAPTGSGKTNLLKLLMADRIQKGHGILFLDFKAEFETVAWIHRALKTVNREGDLRLFSLSNPELSVPYNPLKWGDATTLQSELMNSMVWSEVFYRSIAGMSLSILLSALCEYRDRSQKHFHLGHVYTLLEKPGSMRALADQMAAMGCTKAGALSELASRLERPSERSNHLGLISNLHQMLSSSAGTLLSTDTEGGSLDFKEAITQGRVTVMLMNSLKLKESAQVVGKILLQDLMSFIGDYYSQISPEKHRPMTLIIDEFASFAMPTFIEFMDRARGAGIGIVIAHQARSDLKSISPEFQDRIEANANTTLVSGVKSSLDAEYYSGILGTRPTQKETIQKKADFFFGESETGIKSVREVEEFILHPNRLRDLHQGELFAISRTVDPQWGLVKVPKAPEFLEQKIQTSDLISHLKSIRQAYQTQKEAEYLNLNELGSFPGLKKTKESSQKSSVETWT